MSAILYQYKLSRRDIVKDFYDLILLLIDHEPIQMRMSYFTMRQNVNGIFEPIAFHFQNMIYDLIDLHSICDKVQ